MRYEFREGTSSKFWEVKLDGASVTTTWGRIGTPGQSKTKTFRDAAAAKREHDSLVGEKTRKGYVSVGGAAPAPAAAPKQKAAPAPKPVEARDEKLEATILADRSSEKAWLVYADFLQDQGDPRGELAALQSKAGDAKLQKAADKLLWDKRALFFGPLAPMLKPLKEKGWRAVTATWRHGFMDTLRLSAAGGESSTASIKKGKKPNVLLATIGHPDGAEEFKKQKLPDRFKSMPTYSYDAKFDKQCTLFKRHVEEKIPKALDKSAHKVVGQIENVALSALPVKVGGMVLSGYHYSASLDEVRASFEADGFEVTMIDEIHSSIPDVDEVVELVPLLPKVASARLLRELTLGSAGSDGSSFDFGSAIKALVKIAPSLQSLERLFIGDFTYEDAEISWSSLGNAGPLYAAFPKLKSLTLRAGKMTLGTIAHDHLESFEVITGGLSRQSLHSITTAKLPKLTSLSVWTGDNGYGGTCRIEDLEAFLESPVLANVKHLGLKNCELGDEVVALLAKSKVLARLETLDVSKSHLTQKTVDTITANAKAFSRLKKLDVSNAILPAGSDKKLKTVVAGLEYGKQDPKWWGLAEEMRYTAVGE